MWLAGYRKTIEGTPFPYHSLAPEIDTALLVRANRERPAIAWESAPVPADPGAGTLCLVWVFAIAASPRAATFTLHANERVAVTFANPPDAVADTWTVEGRRGISLRFRTTYRDRFGDPMGFAILSLPAGEFTPGEPVRLRITSEDLRLAVWTMVFRHEVATEFRVEQRPVIRRESGAAVQWANLICTHLGADAEIAVAHEGKEIARSILTFGRNPVPLPLPAVAAPREVTLTVRVADEAPREISFLLAPVKPWTIHLVQHTHTDIGYTRPQTEILPEHLRFIDYALDFADVTDDWPDDAKFRWTCEASWPVREYLASRPPAQVERLRRRVAEGRVELTGMMFNLSEIPDEAGLTAVLAPVRHLRAAGLPVHVAMQNDVNGMAWCLADYLPTVGIDSFIMGQHSHRALACFDRPTAFWWESPSGSRMLGWRGDHYMTGNAWGVHGTDLDAFADGLFRHLGRLEAAGYDFARIAVSYSGYVTDNAPPSLSGPELIRRWNEIHEWPRLRSSTASEFLDYLREEHGDDLPVHRAAWPDWWTDGFGSAARETAAARRTHVDLIATQGIAALAAGWGCGVPADFEARRQDAFDALLFYDEHTLGAAESISDPNGENTLVQWGEKAAWVWEAVKKTRLLREAALGWLAPALPRATEPSIIVMNTLGHARSGLVEIDVDHAILPPDRGFRIVAPGGRDVAAQPIASRTDGTTWLLHVHDVPALGLTALRVAVKDEPRTAPSCHAGPVLESEDYRLEVDPLRGTLTSLIDKELGRDLVDGGAEWGFLEFIHERLGDRHQLERKTLDDFERRALRDVRIEPGTDGPIYRSLVVSGTAAGCTEQDGVRMEIRVFAESKRVQVAVTIRKLRVTDPEGIYVAFPFALSGGEISYEAPGGVVAPGQDQLPGSSSDWHTVQNFARIANDQAEIVITCDEAPLWQFGAINLGRFATLARPEKPHLYSWPMNNYWVTNFRASQEGEFTWHYDLTSGPAAPPSFATGFGWGCRVPLVARVFPASREERGEPIRSLLSDALPPNVLLVGARPSPDRADGLILHLRETDGLPTDLDLERIFGGPVRVSRTDAVGGDGAPLEGPLWLTPRSVRFVRVDVR